MCAFMKTFAERTARPLPGVSSTSFEDYIPRSSSLRFGIICGPTPWMRTRAGALTISSPHRPWLNNAPRWRLTSSPGARRTAPIIPFSGPSSRWKKYRRPVDFRKTGLNCFAQMSPRDAAILLQNDATHAKGRNAQHHAPNPKRVCSNDQNQQNGQWMQICGFGENERLNQQAVKEVNRTCDEKNINELHRHSTIQNGD